MHYIQFRFFLYIVVIGFLIVSLQGCDSKKKNPLIGDWVSENKLMLIANPQYKEVELKFTPDSMSIDQKTIPVIYKLKKDQVILFSRGEKVIAHLLSENKMVLFLRSIGKRIYIKKSD